MKTVAPAQLKAMLHDGGEIALLDVREAGQFGAKVLLHGHAGRGRLFAEALSDCVIEVLDVQIHSAILPNW